MRAGGEFCAQRVIGKRVGLHGDGIEGAAIYFQSQVRPHAGKGGAFGEDVEKISAALRHRDVLRDVTIRIKPPAARTGAAGAVDGHVLDLNGAVAGEGETLAVIALGDVGGDHLVGIPSSCRGDPVQIMTGQAHRRVGGGAAQQQPECGVGRVEIRKKNWLRSGDERSIGPMQEQLASGIHIAGER